MLNKKNRILVLGQTPPPYGGQALMLQTLLDGDYQNAELFHVRLNFSKDFDDIGSFKLYKFWALIKAILQTWFYRFYYRTNVFYYGPAGPNKLAVYRDIILLAPTRFLFKKTIIHTHAGGSSRLYDSFSPLLKFFYRAAFFYPDALITLTGYSHGDDVVMQPKQVFVVPNGIKDEYAVYQDTKPHDPGKPINLLYVGAMYEERGMRELIEAGRILKQRNFNFCIQLVGIFFTDDFKQELLKLIDHYSLRGNVMFLGTKIDNEKWAVFKDADIFCFPTYVPSETFGIVLVEAMQFKIPIIATRWNGIPFVVDENKNGLLVKPKDSADLAMAIERLITDNALRNALGENGRKKFIDNYSIETFLRNMDNVFGSI